MATPLGLIIIAAARGKDVSPASLLVCVLCLWLRLLVRRWLHDLGGVASTSFLGSRPQNALDQAWENEGGSAVLSFLSASKPTCVAPPTTSRSLIRGNRDIQQQA